MAGFQISSESSPSRNATIIFSFLFQESKGKLVPLDIIVNVDTLRIPPPKANVLNESGVADKANVIDPFYLLNQNLFFRIFIDLNLKT